MGLFELTIFSLNGLLGIGMVMLNRYFGTQQQRALKVLGIDAPLLAGRISSVLTGIIPIIGSILALSYTINA